MKIEPTGKHKQNGSLEQLPTTRPGDKVVRRRRKHRGIFHAISNYISKLFKSTASR